MTTKQMIGAGVVGLVLLSAYGNSKGGGGTPVSPAAPPVVVDAATNAALQQLAAVARQNPQAARELAPFYAAAAEVIRRDATGRVGNNEQFRTASEAAHGLAFEHTQAAGQLPGWTVAYTAVINAAIGLEVKVFDTATREKLAGTLEAIAGVCEGA